MASKRNRILELKEYFETHGITVNVGKTRARGNKGFFVTKNDCFRIDIAKNQDEDAVYSTMLHEYAHFVHYMYDKSLNSFEFLFPNISEDMHEELINVSVHYISKEYAQNVFTHKQEVASKIDILAKKLKDTFPDFRLSCSYKPIEQTLNIPARFLLKYDRVKFMNNVYDIKNVELTDVQANYLNLKSCQRMLKRINSRISNINKYYNKPTELISRFVELFFTNIRMAEKLAPECTQQMKYCINSGSINEFSELNNIVNG